jgi:hypothetical protein
MGRIKPHLTYANVMVTILAFVVLGGVAVAGVKLAKNSVGTKQLKSNAVTRAKIKANAIDGSKVEDGSLTGADLNASTLSGYAKSSDLNGYLKDIPNGSVGPDKLAALPAASLSNPIYNVGGPGPNLGVDCFGPNASFPNNKEDDIDFETVAFDSGGLAGQENPSNPNCFNGFRIQRAGTYTIDASIFWEGEINGDRRIQIFNCLGMACTSGASSSQDAVTTGNTTRQSTAEIARLSKGEAVVLVGYQTSGGVLSIISGGLQIAWLGP